MRNYTRNTTWSWTNWTFGVWKLEKRHHKAYGVDIGPLEIVWRKN